MKKLTVWPAGIFCLAMFAANNVLGGVVTVPKTEAKPYFSGHVYDHTSCVYHFTGFGTGEFAAAARDSTSAHTIRSENSLKLTFFSSTITAWQQSQFVFDGVHFLLLYIPPVEILVASRNDTGPGTPSWKFGGFYVVPLLDEGTRLVGDGHFGGFKVMVEGRARAVQLFPLDKLAMRKSMQLETGFVP